MLKELATAIYYVEDMEQAKQWLKQVFDIEPYFDELSYAGYSVNGFEMGIMPRDTKRPMTYFTTSCYWRVADIESALATFKSRGAELGEPIMDVGEGIKVGSIVDPFGNHFGVIENPHFSISQ